VFVGELVKEQAEGKNDGARDAPIDVIPKRLRRFEERAEQGESNQQPDRVKYAQQTKVNQRQVACPASKTEKSNCRESGSQNRDGGRNRRDFPAQVPARKGCHRLSQEKRACVRRVGHVGWNRIQVSLQRMRARPALKERAQENAGGTVQLERLIRHVG
jgi:hypothetical protein